MKNTSSNPAWSTASFGGSTDTSPMELVALQDHLSACGTLQGRFFAMRCAAERMHGYVVARVVSTVLVAALLLIGFSALVL